MTLIKKLKDTIEKQMESLSDEEAYEIATDLIDFLNDYYVAPLDEEED